MPVLEHEVDTAMSSTLHFPTADTVSDRSDLAAMGPNYSRGLDNLNRR